MKCPHCKKHFTDEGRAKGGRNSRRVITDAQQAKMQSARRRARKRREAKK